MNIIVFHVRLRSLRAPLRAPRAPFHGNHRSSDSHRTFGPINVSGASPRCGTSGTTVVVDRLTIECVERRATVLCSAAIYHYMRLYDYTYSGKIQVKHQKPASGVFDHAGHWVIPRTSQRRSIPGLGHDFDYSAVKGLKDLDNSPWMVRSFSSKPWIWKKPIIFPWNSNGFPHFSMWKFTAVGAMIFGCRFLPGKASDDQNAATRGALQTTRPQMEAGVGRVLFLWPKTM